MRSTNITGLDKFGRRFSIDEGLGRNFLWICFGYVICILAICGLYLILF